MKLLHLDSSITGANSVSRTLDGAPVLYVNQAALADFLDEGDRGPPLDYALKFESESEREDFARSQPWWAAARDATR